MIFSAFASLATKVGLAGVSSRSAETSLHDGQQKTSPLSLVRGWRAVNPHREQVERDLAGEAIDAKDISKDSDPRLSQIKRIKTVTFVTFILYYHRLDSNLEVFS